MKRSRVTTRVCVLAGESLVPEPAHEMATLQGSPGPEGQGQGAVGRRRDDARVGQGPQRDGRVRERR